MQKASRRARKSQLEWRPAMYSASFARASVVEACSVFAFSIFSDHSDFALSFSVMLLALEEPRAQHILSVNATNFPNN